MIKKTCETCGKKSECKELCDKIKALIEKEIETHDRWGPVPYDVIHTNEEDEESSGPDLYRKIDLGKQFAADVDNDLNTEWDTLSPGDVTKEILDPKMYDKIKELANICDKKSRKPKIRIFLNFIKCDSVKKLAERANCSSENIRKYLIRMFKCIVERLRKKTESNDVLEEADKLTPTGYKKKWFYERCNHG